jgi:uncharacterized membrane protein YidH (DUF202 family)
MHKKDKMNNEKKISLWLKIILGIIIVVFIVVTLGLFINNEKKENISLERAPNNDNEVITGPIADKTKKLDKINSKIAELEPEKDSIEKMEKRILVGSRIVIAFILLIINGIYIYEFNLHNFSLGDQLNINAALTMVYAFVGFTLYGTPKNFVKNLKRKVTFSLRKKKIILLSELKKLYIERKNIEMLK